MIKRSVITSLLICLAASLAAAQTTRSSGSVLVLPFANRSTNRESNWIGESFAESLADLLSNKGLRVLSNQERKVIQREMRVPDASVPSIATSLRIAQRAGATLLIIGDYDLLPEADGTASSIIVNSRVLRASGSIVSEDFPDGRRIGFNISDATKNLPRIQGELAWEILYRIDKVIYGRDKNQFPFMKNNFIAEAESKVPSRALEAFVKALTTSRSNASAREIYLKNAIREYKLVRPDGTTYADAALELGHFYAAQGRKADSVAAFNDVIQGVGACRQQAPSNKVTSNCSEDAYVEAAFFSGLQAMQDRSFEVALGTLTPIYKSLETESIANMLGVLNVEAARAERKNQGKSEAYLIEGTKFLKLAAESTANRANYSFNYGLAEFLRGNYAAARKALEAAIYLNAKDGEAHFLLARVLELLNDPHATVIDNSARQLLDPEKSYARLQLDWQKSKSIAGILLRFDDPTREDFVAEILSRKRKGSGDEPQVSETEAKLTEARELVKLGRDDEAVVALNGLLLREPMNAEVYLLLGKVNMRRGELDRAISYFKTATFWDNRTVEAYVALVKIYVERKDCQQAKTYATQANEALPSVDRSKGEAEALRSEVGSLQRLVDKCSI
ncbi:MAG: tetratricopeptide repeat protein [Pyrinomonadaceae bacterium]|nr:tetratricopeptide repeat protein [Pyrinomonadaceae bacterium]